ncbi:MAG: hypothetical protein P8M30_15850 [Planctomycetaceae bacterium]|jgi:hypothetical protein|nr:hypothetical protein [Planctomycetaceae bacterium]MDB4786736.1 hypothetical protein [Planctomycetaceae bacterium]MDC0308189.1 hypothetical protein [Planctomycetaceae bacterium]MDG2390783.1 hypothetical protein [Planctomycetaceae bacterium]
MKNITFLILLFSATICLTGCSDSATTPDVPDPPAPSEDDLGDASGSPEDMFLEDTESEGSSTSE